MKRLLPVIVGAVLAWQSLTAAAESAGKPVVVWPLGDSITAGSDGGYRRPMVERLVGVHHVAVTTVGTQADFALPASHQAHEGHGGWRIDQLADNLLGFARVDESAHGGHWLDGGHDTGRAPVRPTVVTLMAGINDINAFIGRGSRRPMSQRSDEILATLQQRMTRLVGTLTDTLPDATILIGGCIPYSNGLLDEKRTGATAANRAIWAKQDGVAEAQEFGVNHWVLLFNRWLRDTYVPQLKAAGKKVVYVDQYANFILPDGRVRASDDTNPQATQGPAGYRDYGLHPNAFGYGLMGRTWADAIHAAINDKQ